MPTRLTAGMRSRSSQRDNQVPGESPPSEAWSVWALCFSGALVPSSARKRGTGSDSIAPASEPPPRPGIRTCPPFSPSSVVHCTAEALRPPAIDQSKTRTRHLRCDLGSRDAVVRAKASEDDRHAREAPSKAPGAQRAIIPMIALEAMTADIQVFEPVYSGPVSVPTDDPQLRVFLVRDEWGSPSGVCVNWASESGAESRRSAVAWLDSRGWEDVHSIARGALKSGALARSLGELDVYSLLVRWLILATSGPFRPLSWLVEHASVSSAWHWIWFRLPDDIASHVPDDENLVLGDFVLRRLHRERAS